MTDQFTKWPDCYDFDDMAKKFMDFTGNKIMSDDHYKFMNGFNSCVEQMIILINNELKQDRNGSESIMSVLLTLKNNILRKHYNKNVKLSEFERVPRVNDE